MEDLLAETRDIQKAFKGISELLDDVAEPLKGLNKEFKDLQGALHSVVSLFRKLGQAGAGEAGRSFTPAYVRHQPKTVGDRGPALKEYFSELNKLKNDSLIDVRGNRIPVSHPPEAFAKLRQKLADDMNKADAHVRSLPAPVSLFNNELRGLKAIQYRLLKPFSRNAFAPTDDEDNPVKAVQVFSKTKTVSTLLTIFGAGLAAAIAGATMFTKKMQSLSTGIFTSGASLSQARQLSGLAGALGMDPASLGQRARGFGDLLTGGGIPAGLASQIGIRPYGGLGGDQNFFNKFQRALQYITDPQTDENRAGLMARQFGMEDLMYLRFASPDLRNKVLGSNGMGSAEEMRKAVDAQIQFNLTLKELTQTLMGLGQAVLPYLTLAFKNLGLLFTTGAIGGLIGFAIGGPLGAGFGAIAGTAAGLGIAALSSNTKAVQDNTGEQKKVQQGIAALNSSFREGIYGGGERMRNAVPGAYGYSLLEMRAEGMGRALGAFSV